MKLRAKFIAVMFVLATTMSAFSINPPAKDKNVQLLPAEAGTLKVLYVNGEKKATVKIFTENGLVFQDVVKMDDSEKGFIKRYDVSKIEGEEFWVEIGDSKMSSKFYVTQDSKGNLWAAYWDEFIPSTTIVASN